MRQRNLRSRLLAAAGMLLFVALWCVFLRPGFMGGPASYIMVSGRSMEPTLYEGDFALTMVQDSYQVGEIVAFRADGGVVIHRIIGGTAEEGYEVKGDNNLHPDAWLPRPQHIIGASVLRLPLAGRAIGLLQQPLLLGAVAGTIAMTSLAGGAVAIARRRRRRNVAVSRSGRARRAVPSPPDAMVASQTRPGSRSPWSATTLVLIPAVVSLVGLVTAVYAWWTPSEVQRVVDLARYSHRGEFTYSALVDPSSLYGGSERLEAAALGTGEFGVRGTPIYSQLLRGLDLVLDYRLDSNVSADLSGTGQASLRIKAGENGWVKNLDLVRPTQFTGPSTKLQIPVDVRALLSLVQAVEEETGFRPTHYEMTVMPTITVAGRLGDRPLQEQYAPPFTFRLTRTELTVDGQSRHTEAKAVSEQVIEPLTFSLLGIPLSLEAIRWGTTAHAGAAAVMAATLWATVYRRRDRSAHGSIRSRYGSLLVEVAEAAWYNEVPRLAVASFKDLARLAQRDGGLVFHYEPDPGAHVYFVPESGLTYEYRISHSNVAA